MNKKLIAYRVYFYQTLYDTTTIQNDDKYNR